MPRTNIETLGAISKMIAAQVENAQVVTKNIDMRYSDKFNNANASQGDVLYIKVPDLYEVSRPEEGEAVSFKQPKSNKGVKLTPASNICIPLEYTDVDLTMRIEDLDTQVIANAATQIAQALDSDAIKTIKANSSVCIGDSAKDFDEYAAFQAKKYFAENGCIPDGQFYGALTPKHAMDLSIRNLNNMYNSQAALAKTYEDGIISTFGGVKWAESANLPTHTNGAWAGTPVVAAGQSFLATGFQESINLGVSGLTNGTTVSAGDVFTIAGVSAVNPITKANLGRLAQFVVVGVGSSVLAAGTTLVVRPAIQGDIYSFITGVPTAGAALTLVGGASTGYAESLVWHKQAIAGASPIIKIPSDMGILQKTSKTSTGFNITVSMGADIATRKVGVRVDVLYGMAVVRDGQVARMRGGLKP